MSYSWELSDKATASVERQIAWYESDIRHGGQELADRWLDRLEKALEKLAEAPYRHGMAPENRRWHPTLEIRQMLFRPWKTGVGWRVLFTVDDRNRVVTILQIRHERRRWLFNEDSDD